MNKRVLVTGGSGFIGSHLVRRLVDEGATVAVMVRYGNVMKNERLRELWDKVTVIEADLRNRGALEAAAQFKPQLVFHLAAYNHVGESFRQVEECFDVNAKGSANLLDVCGGSERFVYMSTSEVYGHQASGAFVETMNPEPISPYAITKYAGELYCRMKQRIGGKPEVVVVRPFNVFGPCPELQGDHPRAHHQLPARQPHPHHPGRADPRVQLRGQRGGRAAGGRQRRQAVPGPINIAAGEEVAIRDLVKKIAELTQTKSSIEIGALPYRPTEIWRMYADSTRARNELGWTPRLNLEEGLKQSIAWYRDYLANGGSDITD